MDKHKIFKIKRTVTACYSIRFMFHLNMRVKYRAITS